VLLLRYDVLRSEHHEWSLGGEGKTMQRCNDLCTKDATGTCALCEALAERDRFERRWFKGGLFIEGFQVLKQRWYSAPHAEVHHKDAVREAYKQYTETLNRTMLSLLGVALFCVLTTLSSPDKLLLAGDSTIKVPFTEAPISFWGFIVVAPSLLIMLTVYLHICFGYWLEYERERQYINQSLIGTSEASIESIPTIFSFPDVISQWLTGVVFYWLVPGVLAVITWKAWALPTNRWC
jgi:hypothetical protein